MSTKQVIVVRKDLMMSKGKLAAQVAHASLKVLLDKMQLQENYDNTHQIWTSKFSKAIIEWMDYGPFTKIVVGVDSEEELLSIQELAKLTGVPNALITDSGKTEFHGVPTNTCLAVGPDEEDIIDKITGDLKLL